MVKGALITHAELAELRACAAEAKKRRRILGTYTPEQMAKILEQRSRSTSAMRAHFEFLSGTTGDDAHLSNDRPEAATAK